MKKLIIHLVSESSGQTVKYAASTALAKFSDIEVKKYHWPMTRTEDLLNEALKKISQKPGIVLYTISNNTLKDKLKRFCLDSKMPCISVVSKIVNEISDYLGVSTSDNIGFRNKFDETYFDKIEAIEYSLKHDDGQILEDLDEADIILIGPSRTSKTPTSVYLAYNGFKTANIPFVCGSEFPPVLKELSKPIIFGFIINPSILVEIRENRMNLLQIKENSDYTDIKVIQEECREIRRLCSLNKWQVIDVSRRSIEETAAIIMKYYYEHKKMRHLSK
jgi:regulator of PEP synthase PpsR (kinase-PPPase family)